MLRKIFNSYSHRARAKRTKIFHSLFTLNGSTKVLDLGGHDGELIMTMGIDKKNIYVGDFDLVALEKARQRGLNIVVLDESGTIPCQKNEYDIIFSNSVIEHVTVDKEDMYKIKTNREFREAAWKRQKFFADQIREKSDKYYVQTPYKYFIIESHSWLPFVIVFLPRQLQILTIKFFNKFWPKKTSPDWNLLTVKDMKKLFPDARIIREKSFFLTKSLIAVKN